MSGLQGFAAEAEWFHQVLADGWTSTPVALDNTVWAPDPEHPEPYVRFSIQHTDGRYADINRAAPIHRYDGMAVFEILVPAGSATGLLDELTDEAVALFRGRATPEGLRLYAPKPVRVGGSGAWFRRNVLIPFQRDTVFT